jgi:hypothetical protein
MGTCCGYTGNKFVFVFGILIVRKLGDGDFLWGYFAIGIDTREYIYANDKLLNSNLNACNFRFNWDGQQRWFILIFVFLSLLASTICLVYFNQETSQSTGLMDFRIIRGYN